MPSMSPIFTIRLTKSPSIVFLFLFEIKTNLWGLFSSYNSLPAGGVFALATVSHVPSATLHLSAAIVTSPLRRGAVRRKRQYHPHPPTLTKRSQSYFQLCLPFVWSHLKLSVRLCYGGLFIFKPHNWSLIGRTVLFSEEMGSTVVRNALVRVLVDCLGTGIRLNSFYIWRRNLTDYFPLKPQSAVSCRIFSNLIVRDKNVVDVVVYLEF